jgi:HlyD family secretion protein
MQVFVNCLCILAVTAPAIRNEQGKNAAVNNLFRTELVQRRDLVLAIHASGTLEPERVVEVHARVSGPISRFGADPRGGNKTIDFGSIVDRGTVLAQIDPTPYEIKVEQAQAQLQKIQASVRLLETRLRHADPDYKRAKTREGEEAKKREESENLQSRVDVLKSELVLAQAEVKVAQAALREAQANLDNAAIKSPIRGIIIDRRVDIGQRVSAAAQAPSLFLIAEDLRRLQVWASVKEGDISHIRPKQTVTFTVDAFPGQVFSGDVNQVRLNAAMTNNVVTYTVAINVSNDNGKLLPYLTAHTAIQVGEQKNVLSVSNAALSWKPLLDQIAPGARPAVSDLTRSLQTPSDDTQVLAGKKKQGSQGLVWLERNGFVRPIKLRLGFTDGAWTQILAGDLTEGTPVVTATIKQ